MIKLMIFPQSEYTICICFKKGILERLINYIHDTFLDSEVWGNSSDPYQIAP